MEREPNFITCQSLSNWLKLRSPAHTAVAVSSIGPCQPFDHAESEATNRAIESRRNEFNTGRRLARIALGKLQCKAVSIPLGEARLPHWPTGYVGSITHTKTLCIAQVARADDLLGLGVDLEPDLPISENDIATLCRPDELRDPCTSTLYFVAKEAFYKAYFPIARTFLDFHDVHVEFDPLSDAFQAQLANKDAPAILGRRAFYGRHARISEQCVAGLWISP